jgi:acetylornithine deacetylase
MDRIVDHARSQVLREMRNRVGSVGDVVIERLAAAPAFEAQPDGEFTRLVRVLTDDFTIRKVAYGTEAGIFQSAGIPTVVCGPGDIVQAHTADEFVELSQVASCEVLLHALADRMGASPLMSWSPLPPRIGPAGGTAL